MKELDIIRWLRERAVPAGHVLTGIGDDAAVLDSSDDDRTVVTTDLILEGTHFSADASPDAVGWKALAVSVSDVAAMGCRARAAVLAVGLRRDLGLEYATRLFEGADRLARAFDVPLVGGDTTESHGGVVICTTVLGAPEHPSAPILRSGARPGDWLLVTGWLGGSIGGRHLDFRPRQEEALRLVREGPPSAMIDISDGLSTDAGHLARESGVRIRLHAKDLPVSPEIGADRLQHALNDGEDFELLFTAPPEAAARILDIGLGETPVCRIGTVLDGPADVTLLDEGGREAPLHELGYEHFR